MSLIRRSNYKQGLYQMPEPVAQATDPKQEKPKDGFFQKAKSFGVGALKGVSNMAIDYALGQDIETFGGATVRRPGFLEALAPVGTQPIVSRLAQAAVQRSEPAREEYLTPKEGAESYGAGTVQIAEMLAPVPGVGKQKLLTKAGIEFLDTAIKTSRQRGEFSSEGLRESVYSAALSPLGKLPRTAIGTTQVGQGAYQISEGDTAEGFTNVGLGLAQLYGARKSKGLLLEEPITITKTQVSGDGVVAKKSPSSPSLPTARQRLGERITLSLLKPTKADIDAGWEAKNFAKYDVLKGDIGESMDAIQSRIAGYNKIAEATAQAAGDPMVIDAKGAIERARNKFVGTGKSLQSQQYKKIFDEIEMEGGAMDNFIPEWRNRRLSAMEGIKLRREAGKQASFHHDPVNRGENTLRENVYNAIYKELKGELDTNLPPEFQEANTALSELIPLQQGLFRRIPVEERQNLIGLTDSMTTIASIFDPKALAFGAVSRATKSPGVASALMRSGEYPTPFVPSRIPVDLTYPMKYPQLPERAGLPKVIEVGGRSIPNTTPSPLYTPKPSPQPKTMEQMRYETLQDVAKEVQGKPIMSRVHAFQQAEMRTMSQDMPPVFKSVESPDLNNPREAFEYRPTQKESLQMKRDEIRFLREQVEQYRFPDEQLEDGYRQFKALAQRSPDALNPDMDWEGFSRRYGRDKTRQIIEDSVSGGGPYGMTNSEAYEAFKTRYITERLVKSKADEMAKKLKRGDTPVVDISAEDAAVFAVAPMGGMEVTYDENGKPQFSYNAEKSLSTMALGAGFIGGKKILSSRNASIPSIASKTRAKAPDTTYRTQHQISDNAVPASSLGGDIDNIIKQHKAKNGYLTKYDQQDLKKLQSFQDKPEMDVTIYRATPKNELNTGDWVTTSKTYAQDIKKQNGGTVRTFVVKAKDLMYPRNIEELPSLARFAAFKYQPELSAPTNRGTSLPNKLANNADASLLAEAKKYKTADEFVKARGTPVYHGTSANYEAKDFSGGYVTSDKSYADVYQKPSASSITTLGKSGKGKTFEFILPNNAKILDYTNPTHKKQIADYWQEASMSGEPIVGKTGQIDWTEGENLATWLEEKGMKFDGIKLDEAGGIDPLSGVDIKRSPSIRIANPNILQTKAQLIDIWKKANKTD